MLLSHTDDLSTHPEGKGILFPYHRGDLLAQPYGASTAMSVLLSHPYWITTKYPCHTE